MKLVVSIVVLLLVFVVVAWWLHRPATISFSPEQWQAVSATEGTYPTPRQMMVSEVKKRVIGLSRQQVVALLGPPTETNKIVSPLDNSLVYVLGPERGVGVDFEWLRIDVNDTGVVIAATVVTD